MHADGDLESHRGNAKRMYTKLNVLDVADKISLGVMHQLHSLIRTLME